MKTLIVMLAATAALGFAQTPAPVPAVPAAPAGKAYGTVLTSRQMYANIELTVYVISGLAQPPAGAATDLPDDLSSTLSQMRGVFAFKTYKLINAFTLRGRSGSSAEMAGDLPMNNWTYDFKYGNASVYENTPGVVHINKLRLDVSRRGSLRVATAAPTPAGGYAAGTFATTANSNTVALVSTDIDVKEGQKTVVGQSAVNGTDALFLVIVPKVIE